MSVQVKTPTRTQFEPSSTEFSPSPVHPTIAVSSGGLGQGPAPRKRRQSHGASSGDEGSSSAIKKRRHGPYRPDKSRLPTNFLPGGKFVYLIYDYETTY